MVVEVEIKIEALTNVLVDMTTVPSAICRLIAAPEISITVSDGIAPSMQSATVTSSSLIEVMFDEEIKFLDGNPPFRPAPTVNGRPTDTPRDIFGDILHVPSQNAFPIDAVLNVSIRTTYHHGYSRKRL